MERGIMRGWRPYLMAALALAAMLRAPAPAAAEKPFNLAVGGIRLSATTADLLHVYERPVSDRVIPQTLQTVDLLASTLGGQNLLIPDITDSRPAAIEAARLKNSEYLANTLGGDFTPMRWEGVFSKGSARRYAIEQMTDTLIAQQRSQPDRPINVVCHSQGCGIALEAFERAGREGVRINKFISVGTRLTGLPGDNRRDKPENVGEWVNVHSRHDQALSKALEGEGILNVEYTGGDKQPKYEHLSQADRRGSEQIWSTRPRRGAAFSHLYLTRSKGVRGPPKAVHGHTQPSSKSAVATQSLRTLLLAPLPAESRTQSGREYFPHQLGVPQAHRAECDQGEDIGREREQPHERHPRRPTGIERRE